MKYLIISLFLITSIQAQNVWYVDRDSPASSTTIADGKSWATAWKGLDSSVWQNYWGVNWQVIGDGDTIYVSGGTDSTAYYPVGNNWYNGIRRWDGEEQNFDEQVVILPAKSAPVGSPVREAASWNDHNGEVYWTTRNNDAYKIFVISNVSGVKLLDFNLVDRRDLHVRGTGLMNIGGSNNTIENWYFYSRNLAPTLSPVGTNIIVRGCYFDHEDNDITDASYDVIGGSNHGGGNIIDRNIIILRNTGATEAHLDIMQFGGEGTDSTTYRTTVISNNLIVDLSPEAQGWNGIMYFVGQRHLKYLVYNNILYQQKTIQTNNSTSSPTGIWAIGYDHGAWYERQNIEIFNNTIVIKGLPHGVNSINLHIDSAIIKNNLFVNDTIYGTSGQSTGKMMTLRQQMVVDIDYNHYARLEGIKNDIFAYYGPTFTWTQWRAHHGGAYDANSDTSNSANVTFVNRGGIEIEDYYTETGRGQGLNLYEAYPELLEQYPSLGYDILGNPRPLTGPWDIGALQQEVGQSNNINVQGKIFLQGPFNGNTMKTDLADSSFLPASQPYNNSPWNYSGSESLILPGGQPGSGYVDWVLVELRNSSNPVEVAGRRAAVLRNDGRLLEPDGSVGVKFDNMQEGLYYIAVFHRNHLAVMSALPVYLNSNSQLYNFTNAMDKAYGINPMADLGNGNFALYSGDGNSNGGVNIHDKNGVWQLQNGTLGYLKGDFDLNGGVNIVDLNDFWNPNNGTEAQLPESE